MLESDLFLLRYGIICGIGYINFLASLEVFMSYTETVKPETGDVMWAFDVGKSREFPEFLQRYKYDGFTLAFLDISTGRLRVEIYDVPTDKYEKCIMDVMQLSGVVSISIIRVDHVFKEYSIGMDMSKTRIQGTFKYVDGEFVITSPR